MTYEQLKFISQSSEDWEVWDQAAGRFGVWWEPTSCFMKVKSEGKGHLVVSNSLRPHGLYSPQNSLGQNTRVGSISLLHPGL